MLDVSRHAVDYWLRQRILQRPNKSSDTYTDNIKKTQKNLYNTKNNIYAESVNACSQHMNWTEWADPNKSTQLHDTFIGHARRRHDYAVYWLAAAKPGRSVLR